MKKIEELAIEKYFSEVNLPERKRTPVDNYIDWANFGTTEDHRWISLNELKEIGVEMLFKNKNGKHSTGKFEIIEGKFCILTDIGYSLVEDSNFTHFRPIERF